MKAADDGEAVLICINTHSICSLRTKYSYSHIVSVSHWK